MAEARRRDAWDHTSEVLAMILNANPLGGGKPVPSSVFHPFARPAAGAADRDAVEVPVGMLRSLFVKDAPSW